MIEQKPKHSHHLFKGMIGILHSPAGVMCLLMFIVSSVALFMGKLDGISYGVVNGVIGGLFGVGHSYQVGKALDNQPPSSQMGGHP